MATEYTITYTYTGQSNTSAARSVAFSKFKASGDTDRTIGQITGIKYIHWHTSTNPYTWTLRGRLVLSNDTMFVSDEVSLKIEGDIIKFTNAFTDLPTAEQFAMLSKVQTLNNQGTTGLGSGYSADLYWRADSTHKMQLVVTFIEEPPVVYAPSITSFDVVRVDADANKNAEGLYIATTLKLAIGDSAGLASATCKIYYAADTYPVVGESQYVDLTSRISELISGVGLNTTILTGVWSLSNIWYFAVVFTAGDEVATPATGSIPRGTVCFHISNGAGGGAAVGGFCSGTATSPKFEAFPPSYLYGGIAGLGDGKYKSTQTALGIQCGITDAITATAETYTDTSITFETPFKEGTEPIVVASFWTTTTAGSHGLLTVVVNATTNTGFTARIVNGSSSTRAPKVSWIAIGEM